MREAFVKSFRRIVDAPLIPPDFGDYPWECIEGLFNFTDSVRWSFRLEFEQDHMPEEGLFLIN